MHTADFHDSTIKFCGSHSKYAPPFYHLRQLTLIHVQQSGFQKPHLNCNMFADLQPAFYNYSVVSISKWTVFNFTPFCLNSTLNSCSFAVQILPDVSNRSVWQCQDYVFYLYFLMTLLCSACTQLPIQINHLSAESLTAPLNGVLTNSKWQILQPWNILTTPIKIPKIAQKFFLKFCFSGFGL